MKPLSIEEFEALVSRDDWRREQAHDVVDRSDRQLEEWDEESDDLKITRVPHASGCASKTSTLDGVTIVYTESFSYDEYDPESLSVGTEGQDDVWTIEGVSVVDEDGDVMMAGDLADYLAGDFHAIDYSVLEIGQVIDIDIDEDSDMETFTVQIDNAPDIRFTGECIAKAASSDDKAFGSSYSGQTGRWTELALYKTKGGKFVCHQVGRTRWQGERDRFSGTVCETMDEVQQFFGHRWLAKELYAEAGIDATVEVD